LSARIGKAGCVDVTCSAVFCMSTSELHERLYGIPHVQAVVAENYRLRGEVERLRELLRQHGIEPNGGTAQTA